MMSLEPTAPVTHDAIGDGVRLVEGVITHSREPGPNGISGRVAHAIGLGTLEKTFFEFGERFTALALGHDLANGAGVLPRQLSDLTDDVHHGFLKHHHTIGVTSQDRKKRMNLLWRFLTVASTN